MSVKFLDCSYEVSPYRETPAHRWAWLASEVRRSDWVVETPEKMIEELLTLGSYIEQNPVNNLQRQVKDLTLPQSRETMSRMKTILDDGVGFCVLDSLPLDQLEIDTAVEIYWLLGQMIGRPVAQKWNGQMIYDVKDTGVTHNEKIRGSHTAIELVFHTDNAFAKMVPDYVGLLCKRSAKSGGISRFCSLYTVHDRMQLRDPTLLQRLYQPMYFNRQSEHHANAPRITLAPFFSWNGDRLNARANSSLVRAGYNIAETRMDSILSDALDALDEICESDDIWFEGPLARGHVQYLNNHEVGHYRSEFIDHEDPEQKRHLYRLWHRQRGSIAYDGDNLDLPA